MHRFATVTNLLRPLFLFLVLLHSAAWLKAEDSAKKIGVLMPFSGEVAAIAEKARKGFALAEERYGVGVKVIYEDTGGLGAAKAVSAANKLLQNDHVALLVGPFGPEQTIPVATLAQRKQVQMLSFTLCSKTFATLSNVFCGYPAISEQLRSMLPVIQSEHLSSLAIIGEESDFGSESRAGVEELAQRHHIHIALSQTVAPHENDFRALVAKIRSLAPDALFVAFGNPSQAFNFLKQLWEHGYRGRRFAFIDYDDKYLREFGPFTEGILVPGAYTGNYSEQFHSRYLSRYQEDPDVYAAEAYDLLRTAILALQGSPEHTSATADSIINVNQAESALPGFRLTPERTVTFPMGVLLAHKSSFVPWPLKP